MKKVNSTIECIGGINILHQGRHGAISETDGDAQNVRGVLLDTRGPEIRMGKLKNDHSGHETILLESGKTVSLHTTKEWADAGSTEVREHIHMTAVFTLD